MKKLIVGLFLMTVMATAASWIGTDIAGDYKVCKYSDGSTITVKSYEQCPYGN